MPSSFDAAAIAVTLLLGSLAASAAEPSVLRGTCRATFRGRSTLHDFEGTSPDVGFDVRRLPRAAGWSAVVDIPVAGLETGSARRDAKMRAMLEADRHPVLRASFDGIDPTVARPATPDGTGTLPFTLAIRDVRRPVTGRVRHWREQADRVVFEVEFPVSLAAFELTAPSVLGVVRVADEVRVTVQVRVASDDAASKHEGQ